MAPGLDVLFCGINPSIMSFERGHHFARPGNRFWPALHGSGFTPRLLTPYEDMELLRYGLGVTNMVDRPTRGVADLSDDEISAYVDTGEPLLVAGAFTIDSLGGPFIDRVEGDPSTVVGMSLSTLRRLTNELGMRWPDLWTPS